LKEDRDPTLDTLLELDGTVFVVDSETGYWVKFVVLRIPVSPERPHGIGYSLTLHGPNGERMVGFDNAHPAAGQKRGQPHDHTVRAKYRLIAAAEIMEPHLREAELADPSFEVAGDRAASAELGKVSSIASWEHQGTGWQLDQREVEGRPSRDAGNKAKVPFAFGSKQLDQPGTKLDRPFAAFRFRVLGLATVLLRLLYGATDCECLLLK
jgi:hypothetical protein